MLSASLHFMASGRPAARKAVGELIERYGQTELPDATCIVTIGGDGTTLRALQIALTTPSVPVFSMRAAGSVGALGNEFALDGLPERLASAARHRLSPLQLRAHLTDGTVEDGIAFNEIAIMRSRLQAVRLRLSLDSGLDPIELFGDGLVVATPLGSTAYCRSLGGAKVGLDSGLMSIIGVALRAPAAGFSAVVGDSSYLQISVVDPIYRPVRVETHAATLANVASLDIQLHSGRYATLLREPAILSPSA